MPHTQDIHKIGIAIEQVAYDVAIRSERKDSLALLWHRWHRSINSRVRLDFFQLVGNGKQRPLCGLGILRRKKVNDSFQICLCRFREPYFSHRT